MKKLFKLTKEGISDLQAEVAALIAKRPAIADTIKTARELGDLSENAEYQSARAEQDRAEARISDIEHILQNVEVIKAGKSNDKVILGSRVTLKSDGKTKEFQVVGTVEADPLNGKISDESPIGKALIGKHVGDDVEITTPAETSNYKIVSIA
jgi:transcription elongation factor GreA